MRLYELQTEPPIKAALRDYVKQGYRLLGQGASAIVLGNGETVIKSGHKSDCWLQYAHAAKNSSNPHVPRIESIEMIGDNYLVKMEPLKDVKQTFFKTGLYQCIAAWLYVNAGWQNAKDVYLNKYGKDAILHMANMLEEQQAKVVEALKLIVKTRGSCNFDCHPDNIMKRADGTIVFNDPLTHQGG